jgi:hypothetical protein
MERLAVQGELIPQDLEDELLLFFSKGLDLLHKSLKPLPNPLLLGEGVRFLPPVSGGLRGVNSTFARGLLETKRPV